MPHQDSSSDYELLEIKGEGSFGEVFSAKRKSDGLVVAVKKIEVENNVVSNNLEREIDILRDCHHPNVVNYYTSFRHKHYMWIVMEYCEVGSIRDILDISEKTLSENQIAFVVAQILLSLVYLHEKGIIHRDLKAGNILLNGDGEVKVADFGVSGKISSPHSKRLTVIGTPLWMAPEIIKGIPYSTSADIWSLGITTIEMADGYPPYSDEHPMKAMFKIPFNPPPTVESVSRFSENFNDFISKCLIKEADLRPSATELLKHPFVITGLAQKDKVKKLVDNFKKLNSGNKTNDNEEEDKAEESDDEYSFYLDNSLDFSTTVINTKEEKENDQKDVNNKVINRRQAKKIIKTDSGDSDIGSCDFSTIIQHNNTHDPKKLKEKENEEEEEDDENDFSSTIVKHVNVHAKIKEKIEKEKEEDDENENGYPTIVLHEDNGNYFQYLNSGDFTTIIKHKKKENNNEEGDENDTLKINEGKAIGKSASDNSGFDSGEEGFPIIPSKSKSRNNSMRVALRNSFRLNRKAAERSSFLDVNNAVTKVTTVNRGVQVDMPENVIPNDSQFTSHKFLGYQIIITLGLIFFVNSLWR